MLRIESLYMGVITASWACTLKRPLYVCELEMGSPRAVPTNMPYSFFCFAAYITVHRVCRNGRNRDNVLYPAARKITPGAQVRFNRLSVWLRQGRISRGVADPLVTQNIHGNPL